MKKNILITIALLLLIVTVNGQSKTYTFELYDKKFTFLESELDQLFANNIELYSSLKKNPDLAYQEFRLFKNIVIDAHKLSQYINYNNVGYFWMPPRFFLYQNRDYYVNKNSKEYKTLTKEQKKINSIRGNIFHFIGTYLRR